MVLFCKSDLASKTLMKRKNKRKCTEPSLASTGILISASHECQYVEGKVATIHKVSFFPPKVHTLKLILYQFPGFRHYNSPGRPVGTSIQNPSKAP